MASRIIAQMVVSGVQIVSRAFITAYQQALRSKINIDPPLMLRRAVQR
jgi:hypothetical protein